MNFKPLGDRLLVKPEPPNAEHNGIVIPEIARRGAGQPGGDKFLKFGRVVAAGPGDQVTKLQPGEDSRRKPMTVQVGDRVLYDHPSNREWTVDGEAYVILTEEQHVLAIAN